MNKTVHDVIIIGAGPAGIACAIQLKRSGINPLVFEKNMIGGLLYNANLVENYPGFPKGIPGNKLALLIKKQLLAEKIKVLKTEVIDAKFLNNKFIVKTGKSIYYSKRLVIASGTQPKKLQENILSAKAAKSVLYEIYRIKNIVNKNIVIIGAGDLAFDYALNLGQKNQITIINRAAKVNCLPLLYQRSKNLSKIKLFNRTILKSIKKTGKQFMVEIQQHDKLIIINADYVIAAIGRRPELNAMPVLLPEKLTDITKLYIIGDAVNMQYRQAVIAAGDGVKAAMMISESMKENK